MDVPQLPRAPPGPAEVAIPSPQQQHHQHKPQARGGGEMAGNLIFVSCSTRVIFQLCKRVDNFQLAQNKGLKFV